MNPQNPQPQPTTQSTPPSVDQSQYVIPRRKSFPKVLIVIILLLLLAGGLTGAYFYARGKKFLPKKETAPAVIESMNDWALYTNNKIGLSVKYPSKSSTLEETAQGINIVSNNKSEEKGSEWNVDISCYSRELSKTIGLAPGIVFNPTYFKSTTVMDYAAAQYIPDDRHTVITELKKGTNSVCSLTGRLDFNHTTSENLFRQTNIYTQILSTFAFIDQTVDTSSWQTYNDRELGISFKYPSEWKVGIQRPNEERKEIDLLIPKESPLSLAISIYSLDNPKNLTAQDFQKEMDAKYLGPHPNYYTTQSTPIKISNVDGFYTPNSTCEPYICDLYLLPDKGKFWVIVIMESIYYSKIKESIANTFTITNQGNRLVAADSQTSAKECLASTGDSVTILLQADMPIPNCARVNDNQQLMITNASGKSTTVTFADSTFTLAQGETKILPNIFGSYLAKGVHNIKSSLYTGSGGEIWLQNTWPQQKSTRN